MIELGIYMGSKLFYKKLRTQLRATKHLWGPLDPPDLRALREDIP